MNGIKTRKFEINGTLEIFNKIMEREPKSVDFSKSGYYLSNVEYTPTSSKTISIGY